MNIAPISSVFKSCMFNSPKKEALPFRGQIEPQKDVFIRRGKKPLSDYYSKDLDNFIQEAGEYILNVPRITYRGLNKIIENYSKDTKIKKFKSGQSKNARAVAMFVQDIGCRMSDNTIKEDVDKQIIYMNVPKKQDKAAREELLGSFVHETVHMLQFETKTNILKESFFEEYYKNIKNPEDMKEVPEYINQLYDGFSKFEQNIFTLISNFLRDCLLDSYVNTENFDRFLQTGHNMNLAKIAKVLLEDAYYYTGDELIDKFGKDVLINYAKERLEIELEAYRAEQKVMEKYSENNRRKVETRFYADVYEKLLEIANNLKLEKIN